MQKKWLRFSAMMLVVALCFGMVPAQGAEYTINPTIRVGLKYGSDALAGANLMNMTGSGYRFGYYDAGGAFHLLGSTAETSISMVKMQNVYYGTVDGRAGYFDSITSSVAVGCYHVQMPGTYASFDEAKAASASVTGGFPAWVSGSFSVRAGTYTTAEAAQSAASAMGGTVVSGSAYGITVVITGTSTVLFQFDTTDAALALGISPGQADSSDIVTWFYGYRYRGNFKYQRLSGGNITVVNVLPMEDYICGVVPSEIGASWPTEAIKTMSVCARTYAMRKINSSANAAQGYDVTNTTSDQVYYGQGVETDASNAAVKATYGKYAVYNGTLAETYYYSSNGGASEDVSNVWNDTTALPYLMGKADPYEALVADKISNYNWTQTFTKAELSTLLTEKGYTNAGVVSVTVTQNTAMGAVYAVTVTDAAGKDYTFYKEKARTMFGLRSQKYTVSGGDAAAAATGSYYTDGGTVLGSVSGAYAIDGSGNIGAVGGTPYAVTSDGVETLAPTGSTSSSGTGSTSGSITFTGKGWGHAVGLSQWGTYAMATQGYTYDQILKFYYTGIEIE